MTGDDALTPQVDQALADLALSAVATLHSEMRAAPQSKDRIAAANSILDRLGYGRTTRVQADVADREIARALEEAAKTSPSTRAKNKAAKALERASNEVQREQEAQAAAQAAQVEAQLSEQDPDRTLTIPGDYPPPPSALQQDPEPTQKQDREASQQGGDR